MASRLPIMIMLLASLSSSVYALTAGEELLLQQGLGLNCTAYTKILNASNTTYASNSSVALILAKWNCTGITGAQTCAAGLFSAAGSIACDLICPAKYYCPGNGSAILCPPGSYSLGGAASSQCTPCPIGSYCMYGVKNTCPAGYLSAVGSSSCKISCPAGYYCPTLPFPILCPSTTYSKGGAAFNCTTCEAGYVCPTVFDHAFCPPNTWSTPGQVSSCNLPCPPGVVCPGNGKMECTVCAPGIFTVKPCSSEGDTICNATCHPGMYGAFYTNGFCVGCPSGTYMSDYGASACKSCNPGKFTNVTGTVSCPNCPEGSTTSTSSGFVNCRKVCPHSLPRETSQVLHIYETYLDFLKSKIVAKFFHRGTEKIYSEQKYESLITIKSHGHCYDF